MPNKNSVDNTKDGINVNQENKVQFVNDMPQYISFGQFNMISGCRSDWEQLILWSKFYLNSRILDSTDLPYVTDHLFQKVPMRFYNFLRMFYGHTIAQNFTNRIVSSIALYFQLIEAQILNDIDNVNIFAKELYRTSKEMADFLESINPFWSATIWGNLFNQSISLTLRVLTNTFSGEYELAIKMYDRLLYQAILMGDYMARGVIENP